MSGTIIPESSTPLLGIGLTMDRTDDYITVGVIILIAVVGVALWLWRGFRLMGKQRGISTKQAFSATMLLPITIPVGIVYGAVKLAMPFLRSTVLPTLKAICKNILFIFLGIFRLITGILGFLITLGKQK